MNIEFLKGFVETVRTKSIAKASENLHISHTALSKQLRSLEKQFDVQLFIRSSQGVELTEAGKVLYDSSTILFDQLSSIKDQLEPYKVWHHIRMAAVPDIAARYLMPALPKLQEEGHEVELLYRQSTKEVYKLLLNGEVDLIVAERISMHPSIWIEDLNQEPLYVVMSKENPLSGQPMITLTELSNQPLVLYNEGCTIRAKLTELFATMERPMHIKTEVDFSEVILGYVGNGDGVTVLPEASITPFSDRLVFVPLHHPEALRTISIFSRNRTKGQKILRFIS